VGVSLCNFQFFNNFFPLSIFSTEKIMEGTFDKEFEKTRSVSD
jgi:hypothetical protein